MESGEACVSFTEGGRLLSSRNGPRETYAPVSASAAAILIWTFVRSRPGRSFIESHTAV